MKKPYTACHDKMKEFTAHVRQLSSEPLISKVSWSYKRIIVLATHAYYNNIICQYHAHEQDKIMHFPTWVDLKGQDAVPDTVHHLVCYVDPSTDTSWHTLSRKVKVHYHPVKDF